MFIAVKLFLKLNPEQEVRLKWYEAVFKFEIERISNIFKNKGHAFEYRYKDISNHISYNSKHLVLVQAKAKYTTEQKNKKFTMPFTSIWSNSSYELQADCILFELGLYEHKELLRIPCYINKQQKLRLTAGRHTNLKLVCSRGKWYALVYVDIPFQQRSGQNQMGIDIGLKVPAVVALSTGEIKFFGNGREIRFQQRRYQSHIEAMIRHHQKKKFVQFQHKLHHVMKDYDHKIAKQIINYAVQNEVSVIKMENLMSINKRYEKNGSKALHHWSYRRLQDYIEYKAALAGIRVLYIKPYNTSRKCPQCGRINVPKDRAYHCSCGYQGHRDAVAAINILHTL